MLYIDNDSKDAAFHFSLEEYIVQRYPWNEPVMMIWQADKCAMLGSNQIADAEIDISYANKENIKIIRRTSGGGTIYTDLGTLLFTIIQPYEKDTYPIDIAKQEVAGPVVAALNEMGVQASIEGRNDILLDGKKISGFAQYMRHGRICTHGSLLYDTDLDKLVRVLRVDDGKIKSKALKSVRSRVTNISRHMTQTSTTSEFKNQLKQAMIKTLPAREQKLSAQDLSCVDRIYKEKYGNPSWTYEQTPKFSLHSKKRFEGGSIEVYLDVIKGIVTTCSIRGDFLGVVPIQDLENMLTGKPFKRNELSKTIENTPLQPYLGTITAKELIKTIFD